MDERSEAERPAGDGQLLADVVDDLEEDPRVRATLVQLTGRVQVARSEAPCHGPAGCARAVEQRPQAILVSRVDEGLDEHVVAGTRAGEQLVDVAARRD